MKGYAQSQSETPDIDNSYVGLAVGKRVDGSSFYITNSDDIIAAAYALPFFIVVVIIVVAFCGIFFMSLNDQVASIRESTPYQANIISLVLLCVILTVFTAILDFRSCVIDISEDDLPGYYNHSHKFLGVTIAGLIIYIFFFMVGLLWFGLEIFILIFCNDGEEQTTIDGGEEGNKKNFCDNVRSKFVPKKKARGKRIALICVLIIGAAVLSITAHFPSILMAWATDPFYASRIALFYGIIVFCYFSSFHYTYVASNNTFYEKIDKKAYFYGLVVPASLFCSFVAISLVVMIITVYVVSVPVNNSIETASEGVTSIYNGAIVLIGGLLAYRIGWQYFGHSFSPSDALENALEKISHEPFGVSKREWKKLTEEQRLTHILEEFGKSEKLSELLQPPPEASSRHRQMSAP